MELSNYEINWIKFCSYCFHKVNGLCIAWKKNTVSSSLFVNYNWITWVTSSVWTGKYIAPLLLIFVISSCDLVQSEEWEGKEWMAPCSNICDGTKAASLCWRDILYQAYTNYQTIPPDTFQIKSSLNQYNSCCPVVR